MQMGGSVQRIDVLPLGQAGSQLLQAVTEFDAGLAQCYREEDRQRLLAIIESTFGTHQSFNWAMRRTFTLKLRGPNDSRESDRASSHFSQNSNHTDGMSSERTDSFRSVLSAEEFEGVQLRP